MSSQAHYHLGSTIAAVATPPGEGGVAIVRISGIAALDIAKKIFNGAERGFRSHYAHFGKIVARSAETIDEVLLLPMLAPRSYTGEDVVEIQCHGGSLITRRVLERVLEEGALPAGPGEFTMRAFLNGKMDLAQAESVQELIAARSQRALMAAQQQLEGALSGKVAALQKRLFDIAAILEAWVDFPEEGLEFASFEELVVSLKESRAALEKLASTFQSGQKIRDGIAVSIVGPPNAGKSSLLNALLGRERAIVTPMAGTTRDLIEEEIALNGMRLRLIDTAGIRATDEPIEQEGIRRSEKAIEQADLVLLVLDVSLPLTDKEREWIARLPIDRTLLVWNKSDLLAQDALIEPLPTRSVLISAAKGTGLDKLSEAVESLIWQQAPPGREEILLTHERHAIALSSAASDLSQVIDGLQKGLSAEFVAADMRSALLHLNALLGKEISEEILSSIFSKFCVGK